MSAPCALRWCTDANRGCLPANTWFAPPPKAFAEVFHGIRYARYPNSAEVSFQASRATYASENKKVRLTTPFTFGEAIASGKAKSDLFQANSI